MSFNIDMNIYFLWNSQVTHLMSTVTFWLRHWAATYWILGKYSTRTPLAHRRFCPKFLYSGDDLNHPNLSSHASFDRGSRKFYQDIKQNPKRRRPLCGKDWWLFHHQWKTKFPWMIFPTNCLQSENLILFWRQSCRYVEHLFQCEIQLFSIVLGLLMKDTWLRLVFSPRGHNGLPRSIIHQFVSFPLLRRPSLVIIPLWVACCERAFSKLFVTIVRRGFWVAAHNGLLRSILSFSFRTPGILISIGSLSRAFWRLGWYVRGRPCNKAHHWSRFRCDSLFSWILLRSFCHRFRTNCRTEMVNVEQRTKDDCHS